MMADDLLHTVLDELPRERLIALILEQGQTIKALRQEMDALKQANEHLRQQLERSQREAKRQAAPFRRSENTRETAPKQPGRRAGHAGTSRPRPASIDTCVDVPLEGGCPHCGGDAFDKVRPIRQVIEELPLRPVEVTELTTYRGECRRCGTVVESSHRLKTSGATGAASVQLGPRAKAVATSLVYDQGLTLRKACAVLKRCFGLELSPGGLAQIAHRTASALGEQEAELQQTARAAAVQHVDETSWWVAGAEKAPYWLWVFADREQTLYRVEARRNREVVEEMLGADFGGVLVSDCLHAYEQVTPRQHKCYAHHLKAISQAQAEHRAARGAASPYLRKVRALLQAAMGLKKAQPELTEATRLACRSALEAEADRLLESRRADPREEKVANRLRKQRAHLFVFLDHEGVEATNNLAERRLRPAVIRRKLSCGNRTERGARTWEILASLAATCAQQGRSFVKLVIEAISFEAQPALVR